MNILLTSAGRRTYMVEYFKQALNGDGKIFASNSILTHTLLEADDYVISPSIYNSDYIDFLLSYCKEKDINAIISLFDIDLPILAKNKSRFDAENIKLVVSDLETTEICNDKWKTYKFLSNIGIKQPKTFLSIVDAQKAITEGFISFPLFIKPRWGMGSIGIYEIDDKAELEILYKKLHREIFKSYLKYESNSNIEACVIIQEALKGQEFGMEVLNDLNGNYITTFAKKKLAMRSGETDIAETVDASFFETTGKSLSRELKHKAILDVDCFVSEGGDIFVLEMNCRFGGQYPFTHNAGVNIPKQIVEWLNGKPTQKDYVTQKTNVKSCKDILPVLF